MALTSRLQTFETEMLAEEENFAGLARIDRDSNGQVSPEEWKLWFDALGGGKGQGNRVEPGAHGLKTAKHLLELSDQVSMKLHSSGLRPSSSSRLR